MASKGKGKARSADVAVDMAAVVAEAEASRAAEAAALADMGQDGAEGVNLDAVTLASMDVATLTSVVASLDASADPAFPWMAESLTLARGILAEKVAAAAGPAERPEPDAVCAQCGQDVWYRATGATLVAGGEVHPACQDAWQAAHPDADAGADVDGAPEPALPLAPPAPVVAPANAYTVVRIASWPRVADAVVCHVCAEPVCSLRPLQDAEGRHYHRVCATQPASAWQPTMSYAEHTPGTSLPLGPVAGYPLCWGCKAAWRPSARPVVANNHHVYHRMCAEWANVLPTGTVKPAPVARQRADVASAADVADMRSQLAAMAEAMANLTRQLAATQAEPDAAERSA